MTTDERGAFVFTGFPKARVHIDARGESVMPARFEVGAGDDPENLIFTVARRCHFRLVVQGTDLEGLSAELRDQRGVVLPIYAFQAGGSSSNPQPPLQQGQLDVRSVSEEAAELRVLRGTAELARQRVTLSPDGVNELRVALP